MNAEKQGRRADEKRNAEREARRPFVDAAIDAGVPIAEVMEMARDGKLPTPEEINERDPGVAVRYWPDVVIRSWWERS